jgi:hypothetical protein
MNMRACKIALTGLGDRLHRKKGKLEDGFKIIIKRNDPSLVCTYE